MNSVQQLKDTLTKHSKIDDKITEINKITKKLRQERSLLEDDIITKIKNMNLDSKKIKINNQSYFIGVSKQSPSLTLDIIKEIATNIIGESDTHTLIEELKKYKSSNKKITPSLKRKSINRIRRSQKLENKSIQSQSLKRNLIV